MLLVAAALLSLAPAATAQTAPPAAPQAQAVAPDPAFTQRLDTLIAALGGKLAYESYFAPAFVAQVPAAQFQAITAQLSGGGAPQRIESVAMETPFQGVVTLRYPGTLVTMRLRVEQAAPHRVDGLLVTGGKAIENNLADVTAALNALHGNTGYVFARLGGARPELLVQHNADQAFAVGSAFKLTILAELVRATNAGERKWDDVVTLDGTVLPGGGYTQKPAGTQVTLRELATQMISISDNSATDILLRHLGRARVEAMLPVIGVADPARDRPFLSTMEAFKLKGIAGLGDEYLALDAAGRRKLLAGKVAAASPAAIRPDLFQDGKPVLIDRIEWFYTPADMVRIMDWLRRNTEGPGGAEARAVLSKNPGVSLDKALYPFIGYKGGSEPGVLNMTLLLRAADGAWYAAAASWNDPASEVDAQRLAGLIAALATFAKP